MCASMMVIFVTASFSIRRGNSYMFQTEPGRISPTYANTCPRAFSAMAEDTARHVSVVDGNDQSEGMASAKP